jgi:hypothetical protein
MQISTAKIFVFIEGTSDRFFYRKLCESALGQSGQYQIRLAQELPNQTGGKATLLSFFSYLRKRSALVDEFTGAKTTSLFYLDKDIDDLMRKCLSSKHLVYTEHYHLENYFFSQGDLVEAVAVAACLDPADIVQVISDSSARWRRAAAANWLDWVKLCVFTHRRGIGYDSNYSVQSRVNNGPYTPVIPAAYATRLNALETRSGLSKAGFRRAFARISNEVEQLYQDGRFDSVFKGAWYGAFLVDDAKRIAGGGSHDWNALQRKLLVALQLTLNFEEPWADHFKEPLLRLVPMLG